MRGRHKNDLISVFRIRAGMLKFTAFGMPGDKKFFSFLTKGPVLPPGAKIQVIGRGNLIRKEKLDTLQTEGSAFLI
jgi:hypothetical protein